MNVLLFPHENVHSSSAGLPILPINGYQGLFLRVKPLGQKFTTPLYLLQKLRMTELYHHPSPICLNDVGRDNF